MANFAGENDPCGLYTDRLANVEILRVLLLLIIEPAPQNTPPHLIQVRGCNRARIFKRLWSPGIDLQGMNSASLCSLLCPYFLNVYGARESISRNEFRQPM
jgi:hypothetical protein